MFFEKQRRKSPLSKGHRIFVFSAGKNAKKNSC